MGSSNSRTVAKATAGVTATPARTNTLAVLAQDSFNRTELVGETRDDVQVVGVKVKPVVERDVVRLD
eukprot:SAG22_NODE_248_length_13909_cov_141.345112_6_plen_67_part_00